MADEKYRLTLWQAARSRKERLSRIISRSSRVPKTAARAACEGHGAKRVRVLDFWLSVMLWDFVLCLIWPGGDYGGKCSG